MVPSSRRWTCSIAARPKCFSTAQSPDPSDDRAPMQERSPEEEMNALTVLAKIKPGEEEQLRDVLSKIQASPSDNGIFHIAEDSRTHSSRWMITHDADNGFRLLMACEYDGDLSSYLSELVRLSPGLDDLWGRCVGYAGKADFEKFIRANYQETVSFYIAFRDETVVSIRKKIAVRKVIENYLDEHATHLHPLLRVLQDLPAI